MVGGGNSGFNISAPFDCHVYLIDGGDELALVDAGSGLEDSHEQILANIQRDGLDPSRLSTLLLTHYHADHAGGAAYYADALGITVLGSAVTADALATADEVATSVEFGRRVGLYPDSYDLRACSVRPALVEAASLVLGHTTVTVYETPGHCRGHVSLLLDSPYGSAFFAGDLVCHGGSVMMQNTQDCSIQDYADSVFKVEALTFDAFLPGHHGLSLRNGSRHVKAAADAFRNLPLPPNAIRPR